MSFLPAGAEELLPGTHDQLLSLGIGSYVSAAALADVIAVKSGQLYDLYDLLCAACLFKGASAYHKDQGHPFTVRTVVAPNAWTNAADFVKLYAGIGITAHC